MSVFLSLVCSGCLVALFVAAGLALYRMILGPTAADRAVALDVLVMVFLAVICVFSIAWSSALYFDAVWILTLVGFLGSAAIAKFLETGKIF